MAWSAVLNHMSMLKVTCVQAAYTCTWNTSKSTPIMDSNNGFHQWSHSPAASQINAFTLKPLSIVSIVNLPCQPAWADSQTAMGQYSNWYLNQPWTPLLSHIHQSIALYGHMQLYTYTYTCKSRYSNIESHTTIWQCAALFSYICIYIHLHKYRARHSHHPGITVRLQLAMPQTHVWISNGLYQWRHASMNGNTLKLLYIFTCFPLCTPLSRNHARSPVSNGVLKKAQLL